MEISICPWRLVSVQPGFHTAIAVSCSPAAAAAGDAVILCGVSIKLDDAG